MRLFFSSAVVIVLALGAGSARADGLFHQLPKDGTWARYETEIVAKFDVIEFTATGSLRMASVGRATEKDQPCRWIEVNLQTKVKFGEGKEEVDKHTAKVLIPEKHLKKGESPLDHVVRGWLQRERAGQEREPVELEDAKDANRSVLPILVAAPLKDAQELEEVVVESKLGKLSCAGLAGQMEFKMRDDSTLHIEMENRLHPKAPFGVVTSRLVMQGSGGTGPKGQMTWNLKLSEFGENAKSELPDKQ